MILPSQILCQTVHDPERLEELASYHILRTQPEQEFYDIVRMATEACRTPYGHINFIDDTTQWFKAEVGFTIESLPIEDSICIMGIQELGVTIIKDMREHPRLKNHKFVKNPPFIQFYAGIPIITKRGFFLGTLCVLDVVARDLDKQQNYILKALARTVITQLDLRRALRLKEEAEQTLQESNRRLDKQVHAGVHALMDSSARIKTMFETSFVHQLYLCPKGYVIDANPIALRTIHANFSDVSALPVWKTPWLTSTPELIPQARKVIRAAVQGKLTQCEIHLNLPSGILDFNFSIRPVRNEQHGVVGMIVEAIETTQWNKTQAALQQAQKMEAFGQLTGGIAHDFNNLLTIIKSSTELLRKSDLSDQKRQRYIDAISTTVDRASKLTGQLLSFARKQTLNPQPFDVKERLSSIVDMVKPIVGARVHIELAMPHTHCWTKADRTQFETAIVNLLVNARDAMHQEGIIAVFVEKNVRAFNDGKRYLAISIADTGCGIPEQICSKVFEPFYTTKEIGKGTGLGLSQVFGFAKQSGGDIRFKSKMNVGSIFTLYLPQHTQRTRSTQQTESKVALAHDPHHHRILVVEDDPEIGKFAVHLLKGLGYKSDWAQDGKKAIAMLQQPKQVYTLVFSDIMMPNMTGLELSKYLRKHYPGLPIVLTTGYSQPSILEEPIQDTLVRKPYCAHDLSCAIEHALKEQSCTTLDRIHSKTSGSIP